MFSVFEVLTFIDIKADGVVPSAVICVNNAHGWKEHKYNWNCNCLGKILRPF